MLQDPTKQNPVSQLSLSKGFYAALETATADVSKDLSMALSIRSLLANELGSLPEDVESPDASQFLPHDDPPDFAKLGVLLAFLQQHLHAALLKNVNTKFQLTCLYRDAFLKTSVLRERDNKTLRNYPVQQSCLFPKEAVKTLIEGRKADAQSDFFINQSKAASKSHPPTRKPYKRSAPPANSTEYPKPKKQRTSVPDFKASKPSGSGRSPYQRPQQNTASSSGASGSKGFRNAGVKPRPKQSFR